MYSVFVNDRPLLLSEQRLPDGPMLSLRYDGRPQNLLPIVNTLESGGYPEGAHLYGASIEQLWADFQSLFKEVAAAGGAVLHQERLLCIYRRGSWDLPKGKIDPGESPLEAAVREVQEETGIQQLSVLAPLPTSYHVYREKGKRILKPTYWFAMQTDERALTPQAEEDIEKAEWVPLGDLAQYKNKMYRNLHGVVDAAIEQAGLQS